MDEVDAAEHVVLDTSLPRGDTLSSLREALALSPRGFVA
jgi:hypothetical protein